MLSARKNMDVVGAYARLGTYRAAGEACGVDPKTVKRKVLAYEAGLLNDERAERAPVPKNTDGVRGVVLEELRETAAGGRRSGCCRSLARPGMRVRTGISVAWSPG